jgi:AmmeMemoRadiSam system protein B
MMDQSENPKVRWLDVVPTMHDGREAFVIRDPEGITENALLVSRDVLFLISLMDGGRSARDIQFEFMKASGLVIQEDRVTSVIRTLDDHFFLLNGRYKSQLSRLMDEYGALPFRNACLAGKSYPNEAEALRSYLASFVEQKEAPVSKGKVKGIIAPHIDYGRGLEVYGPIYRCLPRDENTLFVVFGTCHKPTRKVWSIALRDVMTPLGKVSGAAAVGGIVAEDQLLKDYVDEWPHRNEHSIELQLPIMQFLMEERKFEVLSILTGSLHEYMEDGKRLDQGEICELIKRLKEVVLAHEGPVVFVAAADLAHIGAQFGDAGPLDRAMLDESKEKDHELLKKVTAVNAAAFFETVRGEGDKRRICGLAPIYFVLSMLDSHEGELVKYGQWTDGASSVSFAGAVFY